jgi:hypothetical protein
MHAGSERGGGEEKDACAMPCILLHHIMLVALCSHLEMPAQDDRHASLLDQRSRVDCLQSGLMVGSLFMGCTMC